MAQGRRTATIKDVAAAAGVGIATVSRVFSGTGSVSAPTRARVLAAAAELDYRPSALGRGLKLRSSGGIGLVVPDVTDPFRAELIAGVLACAASLGEHVVLDVSHGDAAREAEIVDRLVGQRVDGIIAIPAGETAEWRAAAGVGASVVFADRALPGLPEIPSVRADDGAGVRALAEYLVGLGHRRVAFLGAAAPRAVQGVRERAFRTALGELGVPVDEDLVVTARPSRDSAYAAAAGLLQRRQDATAVLAAGHLLGEAAVLVARELDLRVPADVSIGMVDDAPWAELCDPPLTAVARPAHDIGYRATELLLRDRSRRGRTGPVLLPTELVVRGSCGPPRTGRGPGRGTGRGGGRGPGRAS
ncbi:LacI family DNA-binding transcriptional regulator [Actinomadura xylanilytica]|uniref:LacI family DNA-binding transcriptional regulator n=1 Tax=Actinomadura xylanilytica TaxID=887459 RepID=UPI00255ABA27|nr:LacI family DNA-binding transcriptional regulator [Actinomadura xylanilytica]MDL4776991.1 LacI family DNA-binding transcriptional regulator [Actinomadura xylanilytica]